MSPKRWPSNRRPVWTALMTVCAGVMLVFLTLPVVALALTPASDLVAGLRHPLVLPALKLTLFTTTTSLLLIVLLGTPLSWLIARGRGRTARVLEIVVGLPIVMPPAVAGIALLLAFGRRGPLAGWLYPEGTSLAFSTLAVILAEVFVAAPFFLQTAISSFRALDPELLVVARSLGASPPRLFARIALPLALPGLLAGAAMSWARALGEFGATLMFAGNLPGRTTTLPLAIYTALESDLRTARALSLILLGVAFVLLIVIHWSVHQRRRQAAGGQA